MLLSMNEQISQETSWAFASDKLGRWLLHLPSGVVGKVARVYAPGEYGKSSSFDEVQDRSGSVFRGSKGLDEAVIGFEDGNAFLADPKNFQILVEGDVQVFLALTQALYDLVMTAGMTAAKNCDCTPEGIAAVTRAALQAQLRALAPR